ncbi:MAG: acyltransferase [Butyrivibrio sp.]|nr:acyltransferase [Butyrivibrio sp.]
MTIGDHCFFNTGSSITSTESITIGSYCKFGNNLVIVDHDHNYKRKSESEPEFIGKPIVIGDNTWVGANVVILKGVTIGNNCVIGAGSIITKDIPDGKKYISGKTL